MASSKEYLDYVLEQLSGLSDIKNKKMMGEYILYYRGKIFGGIYDDRLLVKTVEASEKMISNAPRELPYDGAKEMLLVEGIDDKEFMAELIEAMYDELPEVKKKENKEIRKAEYR